MEGAIQVAKYTMDIFQLLCMVGTFLPSKYENQEVERCSRHELPDCETLPHQEVLGLISRLTMHGRLDGEGRHERQRSGKNLKNRKQISRY